MGKSAVIRFYAYLVRVLVAFDVFVNVLALGENDETISARIGRAYNRNKWWGRVGEVVLDNIETGHSEHAILHDLERAEEIAEIERKENLT